MLHEVNISPSARGLAQIPRPLYVDLVKHSPGMRLLDAGTIHVCSA
jgi:hypothetical protein